MSVAGQVRQAVRIGGGSSGRRVKLAPYLFISPFYIIFLAFGLLPIVFSAVVSLYDWQGTTPGSFVGFSNYQVLLQDSDFYTSLWNTVWIWLGSVPTMVLLALIFASILNSKTVWFRSLFRT